MSEKSVDTRKEVLGDGDVGLELDSPGRISTHPENWPKGLWVQCFRQEGYWSVEMAVAFGDEDGGREAARKAALRFFRQVSRKPTRTERDP